MGWVAVFTKINGADMVFDEPMIFDYTYRATKSETLNAIIESWMNLAICRNRNKRNTALYLRRNFGMTLRRADVKLRK